MVRRFAVILVLLLAGCATPSDRDRAGFYDSNYPGLSSNERAKGLMRQLDYEKRPYTSETKTYKIKVIYVYDSLGRQIFPRKERYEEKRYR